MSKQKQQMRADLLTQRVNGLLESGLWGTLYDDLSACYRSVGLTIPAGFTILAKNKEDAVELKKQINDKRISVLYSPDAEIGERELVLKAVFR